MKNKMTPQIKVGLFVLSIFIILIYATVKVSQTSLTAGGTYAIFVEVESASGINKKTPIEIAGIQVGVVEAIKLTEKNTALIELAIQDHVKLSKNVQARIKTVGFLGDTYIELYQSGPVTEPLSDQSIVSNVANYGDFNSLTGQFSSVAEDVKAITKTMRELMAGQDSSFAKSLKNIEIITQSLGQVTSHNQANLNAIIANLKALSENLNYVVARNRGSVNATIDNFYAVSEKVRNGEGTIGRLLNDDETVDKLNESIDNLNELLGSGSKMKVDLGYHAEYLGNTKEFKNYVSLYLKPRPDKYFLFEFVDDPSPDSTMQIKNTTVTSGGVTSTVREEIETVNPDKFLFSAQIAKEFHDFTFRGGLIESSGGVGLDYGKGPVSLKFSAFDFETKRGEKPHIKAMGTFNVTDNLYLLGGYDDIINTKEGRDWFMGAGLRVSDDDIKSLVGLMSLKQ